SWRRPRRPARGWSSDVCASDLSPRLPARWRRSSACSASAWSCCRRSGSCWCSSCSVLLLLVPCDRLPERVVVGGVGPVISSRAGGSVQDLSRDGFHVALCPRILHDAGCLYRLDNLALDGLVSCVVSLAHIFSSSLVRRVLCLVVLILHAMWGRCQGLLHSWVRER